MMSGRVPLRLAAGLGLPIHVCVLAAFPALADGRATCPLAIKTPLQVVQLYPRERVEQELQRVAAGIPFVCGSGDGVCVEAAFRRTRVAYPVASEPGGEPNATLEVGMDPKDWLHGRLVEYRVSTPFMPPIYDADAFYGPWFHATLLDRQGAWYKIVMLEGVPRWIKAADLPILTLNQTGRAYYLDGRNIVVTGFNAGDSGTAPTLTVRDAQPADEACGDDPAPALEPFRTATLRLGDLYDAACNVKLRPAHGRGC
jgi:hypothetical protein